MILEIKWLRGNGVTRWTLDFVPNALYSDKRTLIHPAL
jgi:hypothetical protein